MATASSDSLISSRSSSVAVDTLNNSPKIRRNHKGSSAAAAPWVSIVRAESSELVPPAAAPPASNSHSQIPPDSDGGSLDISVAEAAPPDIADNSSSSANNNNVGNKSKKPAWNKPSNGNGIVEVSPVMGAVSWPALSDSAKASPKSSSESLKALADGSVSATASSQVQGAVVAIPQQKPVNANVNPNLGTNHHPVTTQKSNHHPVTTQKSGRRSGGGGGSANNNNGGGSQLSPRPATGEMPYKTAQVVPGNSPRDHQQKNHVWESGQRTGMVSQGNSGNDHQSLPQQQRSNSFRRGSGGHHRGDGNNHYSHGNRREDRANHDSNPSPRGFNGRDGHMQPRVNQRNFVRPMQPSTASFISPPPVRPFGFPDMASPVYYVAPPPPESLRAVPYFAGAPFMILPGPDPQLLAQLAIQIEYYFSPENLCKDIFLRKYMDAQGWVSISIIANFNRVKKLTNNIPFILESVRNSTIVEIQGERIRKRNDWMNWLLQPTPSASDPLSAGMQSVEIDSSAAVAASTDGPGDSVEDTKAMLNRESQH